MRTFAIQIGSDIQGKRGKASRVGTDQDIIHEHVRFPIHGAEVQQDIFSFPWGGHRKGSFIPQLILLPHFFLHAGQEDSTANGTKIFPSKLVGSACPFGRIAYSTRRSNSANPHVPSRGVDILAIHSGDLLSQPSPSWSCLRRASTAPRRYKSLRTHKRLTIIFSWYYLHFELIIHFQQTKIIENIQNPHRPRIPIGEPYPNRSTIKYPEYLLWQNLRGKVIVFF